MDDNENVVEAKSNLPFFPNLNVSCHIHLVVFNLGTKLSVFGKQLD